MSRIKTIRASAAVFAIFISGEISMAESRIADIYAPLSEPRAAAFFAASSMEPPPSGAYIIEDLTIDGSREFTHVAGDGAGGAFVELPDGRIFLISSEGEAAGIAPDLDTAIRVSVGVNGLHDALRFIKGDVASDHADWVEWTLEWARVPGPYNDTVLRAVGYDPIAAPFETLHRNVSDNADVTVSNTHGTFVSFAHEAPSP